MISCRRLTLALAFPLGAACGCADAQGAPPSAAFNGSPVVEVPYRIVHGLLVIPVSLNGRPPLQLILDTGAPLVLIRDSAVASTLDLTIVGRARVGGVGDGEMRSVPYAAGITARIGSFEIRNVNGMVGGVDGLQGVDGVIGGPVFSGSIVEFDFDRKVIRFHDPTSPILAMTGDTVALRVESSLQSYLRGSATVNGKTMPLDLHLDTGARQALSLVRGVMAKNGATPSTSISTIVGFGSRGAARGDLIRASQLRIGGDALNGIAASIIDQLPGGEANLGLPVLERFHLWVDYPHRRLVLKPRANFAEPFLANTTGLVFWPAKDSVVRVIADVPAGTPAHDAGLQVGDTLVSVNGRALTSIDEELVRSQIILAKPGTALVLGIRRNGATVEHRVMPRVLLP